MKNIYLINRILLGLVMLGAGALKLAGLVGLMQLDVTGMFASFGFPAPAVFAWLITLLEIASGLAILAKWKLKYAVWPPIVILVVAAFLVYWNNVGQMLVHLALASNYLIWGMHPSKEMKK